MATADRLIEVFNEAKTRPAGAERGRFLDEVCRDDAALKEQVLSLLKAHEGAGDFLQKTPLMFSTPLLTEKPGDRIGRYKLLEQIGEGGCGIVYMAEQEEPVRRRVALKVIKLGMDTKQVIARFEAERQALALMDHPNIAKVLDAGATETGRPFFVMELVRGIRITDYCDQNNLSTPDRLELFIQVCQAIQHAHQKGIIHRDIKPSNILVAQHDDVAVPKVIDFGIAKATTGQLTDKTLFTAFTQFIGTPAYMSPEQAQLSGLDIDTRADIYSLGVLLYELLTGQTPFDQKELLAVGLDEMRRIIREKEPPKPSTRLTQELVAAEQAGRAAPRAPFLNVPTDGAHGVARPASQTEEEVKVSSRRLLRGKELVHLIRGDLDWLVMKCLEKDRTRRYETANALALDLQRHLNSEPVEARPPSNLYRFQKMVHRNKLAFAAASAVVAALVLGFGVSTWMFFKEKQAREKAHTEAIKSEQVAQFLKDMLQSVQPSVALGRDTSMLREILDKTAERVGNDLKNQPEAQAELLTILGLTYAPISRADKAEIMHQEALRIRRSLFGETNALVAASLNHLARVLISLESFSESEALARQSLAINRNLYGSEHPEIALSLYVLASALQRQGKFADAEIIHREGLAMRKKLLGDHADVASSLNNLALVLQSQNRHEEAATAIREALTLQRKLYGNEYPDVAISLRNLSAVLRDQGKLGEAEKAAREGYVVRRKLLGSGSPMTKQLMNAVIELIQLQGKPAETETLHREEIGRLKSQFGDEHVEVAAALQDLSIVLREQGKMAEAEVVARETLGMRRKLLGSEHLDLAATLDQLSFILRELNKLPEAESTGREALAIRRKRLGNENVDVAHSLHQLAWALNLRGKFAESESLSREELALKKKIFGNEHIEAAFTLGDLAFYLRAQNKMDELEATAREAIAIYEKLAETPLTRTDLFEQMGHGQWHLAKALDIPEKRELAQRVLQDSLEVFQKAAKISPANLFYQQEQAFSHRLLGNLALKHGKVEETERHYRSAIDFYAGLKTSEPKSAFYRREECHTAWTLATILDRADRAQPALAQYRNVVALLDQAVADFPEDADLKSRREGVRAEFATMLRRRGKTGDAVVLAGEPALSSREGEIFYREALAKQRAEFGSEHRSIEQALVNLAHELQRQGKLAEAEIVWREELALEKKLSGNEHLFVANSLQTLGSVLRESGKWVEAEATFREALAMQRKLLGNENISVATSLSWLGTTLLDQKKHAEAEAIHRELLSLRRKLTEDDLQLGSTLASLTRALLNQEKFAEAETFARECLEVRERKSPEDWRTFNARGMVGAALLGQKRYAVAEPLLISSLEGMKQREETIPASSRANVKEAIKNLVKLYKGKEQPEDVAKWKKELAEFDKPETVKKAP